MNVYRRIVRYLILWGVLFLILCIVSVIKHWDDFVQIMSYTFESYLSLAVAGVIVAAMLFLGFRMLLRPLR